MEISQEALDRMNPETIAIVLRVQRSNLERAGCTPDQISKALSITDHAKRAETVRGLLKGVCMTQAPKYPKAVKLDSLR